MRVFLDDPKMQRIMDFEFIPFGNAYFGGELRSSTAVPI